MVRFALTDSAPARWSRRLAVFAIPVLVLTALLHRFGQIETPVALFLLGAGLSLAIVALGLGVWGSAMIWKRGDRGARNALTGMFLALALLSWPVWLLSGLATLPRLNDITTDWQQPPSLSAAARDRPESANAVAYQRGFVLRQAAAYPEIVPFFLSYAPDLVYRGASLLAEQRGWRVLSSLPPTANAPGRIEAVARTLLFGFEDDVAIRITPRGPEQTRVDMRSASRYGRHDLGANAQRVYAFLTELQDILDTDPASLHPEEELVEGDG
jgi:hypothetical protein